MLADEPPTHIRRDAPEGYGIPKAAADLLEHAKVHGWSTLATWNTDRNDAPFLNVQVVRPVRPCEAERVYAHTSYQGPAWYYSKTWHSRGCAPGRMRLSGTGLTRTPSHPRLSDAPSVKVIRELIAANPDPVYGKNLA